MDAIFNYFKIGFLNENLNESQKQEGQFFTVLKESFLSKSVSKSKFSFLKFFYVFPLFDI